MHCSKHACDEFVYAVGLLYKRDESSNSALVICSIAEMRKHQLLERLDLVLQGHEIRNGLIPGRCQHQSRFLEVNLTLHSDR
jgi:hypothetical protein